MQLAPLLADEVLRLKALSEYDALDTAPEAEFDGVVRLAAQLTATPISLIGLMDKDRLWYKAQLGLAEGSESPRHISMWSHVVAAGTFLEIPDALLDPRFVQHPLVVGAPHIRFYAGIPLINPEGFCLGVLCVIDHTPRTLSDAQKKGLQDLAQMVVSLLEKRKLVRNLSLSEARHRDAEALLRESNLRFETASRATRDVIWDLDLETDVLWCSANYTEMFGFAPGSLDLRGASNDDHIHPEDRVRVRAGIRATIEGGGFLWTDEYRFRNARGQYVYVYDRAYVMRTPEGKAIRMIGCMVDLTGHRLAEERALERERRQALIAEFGQEALANTCPQALMEQAVALIGDTLGFESGAVLELAEGSESLIIKAAGGWLQDALGQYRPETVLGVQATKVPALLSPVIVETRPLAAMIAAPGVYGVEVPIPGGQGPFGVLGAYCSKPHVTSHDDLGFMQSIATIIATALTRQQSEEKLVYLAQFDALTGLPNRLLFRDRIAQSLVQADRNEGIVAVLSLNLDRFKMINNTHSHDGGDALLAQVAQRMVETVTPGDTVSRLVGDEFGIILSDIARAEDAAEIARKLLSALAQPFQLDGRYVYITASIGIALFSANGRDPDVLLKNADIALHRAKEQGRDTYQFYTPQMNEQAVERMSLETDLRLAVERQEFRLFYQPKLDFSTGMICGAEALLRWNHPERGLVSPAEFIPMLEETGLILPVGLWVLETACRTLKDWQQTGLRVPPIAINLSARQFQDSTLDRRMREIIEAAGVSPHLIELEITESMLMDDPQQAVEMLTKLKQLGLTLAVDDFGTGYSSLAYLKRFPLDALKIDRAFVRDITSDPDDAAIAIAVSNLAHNLRLKVVAEGVETEAQCHFLRQHGCDMLQGYYFSGAVEPEAYAAMLRQDLRLKLPQLAAATQVTGPSILLLDDNDSDLDQLEDALRGEGYNLMKASTPEQAFETLAGQMVNMVIADYTLPQMTGIEFLSRVKRLYPDTVRIVHTGIHDTAMVTDAINTAAIHKLMSKTWDLNSLRTTVRDAFRRSAAA